MTPSTKLQDSLFRDLTELCPDSLYVLDESGAILYVNAAVCTLTEYSPDDLLGRSFGLLIGEDRMRLFLSEFSSESDRDWARPAEVRCRDRESCADAVIHWRRARCADGRSVIAGDLEVAESRPSDPVVSARASLPRDNPYPVLQISSDGVVTYGNRGSEVILTFWGCPVNGRLSGDVRALVSEIFASGQSKQLDIKCADRVYNLTFVPSLDTAYVNVHGVDITDRLAAEMELKEAYEGLEARVNQRTAALTEAYEQLVNEITERKRVEEELREINQKLNEAQSQLFQSEKLASVGQLAAGVAHEINNPVGYVKSNLGSLKQYVKDLLQILDSYESMEHLLRVDEAEIQRIRDLKAQLQIEYLKDDLMDLLSESQEGIERVSRIVQDLKDFSHMDEAEWQWVDIHKCLESTLNIVRNEIKYTCDVVKDYGALPSIECIPSRLKQVFTNILVNASQAIEHHGVITVSTGVSEAQGYVWVEITDTGLGIPPDIMKHIFDPFFTTKPVGKGTGLGLSLSYRIIRDHHGRIEVTSSPGQGATFRIWLPVAQSEMQADNKDAGQVGLEPAVQE